MIGRLLGSYEVLAKLGEGGMGEVYRARDSKLKREVAIKVLPADVASDRERLARFQREAEVLAALNHPNIAHIYGLEYPPEGGRHPETGGRTDVAAGDGRSEIRPYIIMELVEGEDLARRLARGPVALDEALPIAKQICDALEAAHEQGIIHRDLKPANIKVRPDGTVKVLDFGLAKALQDPETSSPQDLSASPTITSPAITRLRQGYGGQATEAGVILGTAAYMAPEQAKGKPVDKRADIWAFGCVLYEMLSGTKAFDGDDVTDTIVAVMSREPDWSRLNSTPAHVQRLIRRCMDKDPRRRLRDIGDARQELEDGGRSETATDLGHGSTRKRVLTLLPWVLAGVLAIALAAIGIPRTAAPSRFVAVAATLAVGTPDLTTLTDRFAVAPDGGAIVLVGNIGGLSVRRRGELTATPIPGAPAGAFSPVFSPDGQWIAFSGGDALMKIPVSGGTPITIARSGDYFMNLTWSADDRIRYPSRDNTVIRSVSANGGAVEDIRFDAKTWVNRAYGLPGGRLLVSVIANGNRTVMVREADGRLRPLIDGWDGRLTPTGHVLFAQAEGSIWSLAAVTFDVRSATVTGTADVLASDIGVHYANPAAATASGDLYFVSGEARSERRIVMIDATGSERDLRLPPGGWVHLRLAADGRQLALSRWDNGRRSIWVSALDTGALTRVTYGNDSFYPVWMPDGRRLLFTQFLMDRESQQTSMWSVAIDGAGKIEPIGRHSGGYPTGTSADGRTMYYRFETDAVQTDILQLSLDSPDAQPTSLIATPAVEAAAVPSPDGRWLAYSTEASGREEVRVLDLLDRTRSTQVSAQGGRPIRWSTASTQLYYQDGSEVSVIEVGRGGPIPASKRVAFRLPPDLHSAPDVTPDGTRALAIRGGPIYQNLVVLEGVLRR